MEKIVLSGLTQKDFEKLAATLKASKFRARQIHNWIYLKSVKSIDEMTDLSKDFREQLSQIAVVSDSKIKTKQVSTDGTIKYLIEYPDGNCVETVLMRFDNRANLTACVSSQIGCAVNCGFCATAKRGFIRNLTPAEIVEQVLTIQRDTGLKVTNVVFMGQGEPLLNLENVLKSLQVFNEDFQIGARRITISTSGIIPSIDKLAQEELQSTLAISLHAPVSEVRKKIMPIETKYPLSELKKSLKNYIQKTGRRITIEYLLIKDLTDTIDMAKKTAEFLKDLKCNVNLIPYNPICKGEFEKPSNNSCMKFKYVLEHSGKKVTIRLERGADIDAACGQLSGKSGGGIERENFGRYKLKALIQRVKNASVSIDGEIFSEISAGMLIFLGVEKEDTLDNAKKLAEKLIKLRIFEDEDEKMNLSVQDVKGEILVVSQFTLAGDCKKGTRPSFDRAAKPEIANKLYEDFVKILSESGLVVKTGKFQAMMEVSLVNDGPVTFMVEK